MHMTRTRRHRAIRALLARGPIRSQGDLRDSLETQGIDVTQATLSRDLREIGVVKGPGGYRLPGKPVSVPADVLEDAIRRELVSAAATGALVVLRTEPGHANALAIDLDTSPTKEILGTIAGDDTVFVATPSPRHARRLLSRFDALVTR